MRDDKSRFQSTLRAFFEEIILQQSSGDHHGMFSPRAIPREKIYFQEKIRRSQQIVTKQHSELNNIVASNLRRCAMAASSSRPGALRR
ncbi:MAG TPA: hypothetical protein VHB49_21355 [Bradyrhizobium sp.]|nr:hypothetical protein [Bradyrhizobium sp.]